MFCPAFAQIGDFLVHSFRRITMHQIGIALFGDQLFRRGRFASRVQRWPRFRHWFRFKNVIFHAVIFPRIGKMVLLPHAVQNVEPFAGARVAVVMLLEGYAILARFVRPPRRDHVQSKPAVADLIDVGGLLRQQRRQMKRWAHRHH